MRETWTFHSAGQLLFGPNASRQLGDVADPPVADAAREAADALFRGIVAASSVVGV